MSQEDTDSDNNSVFQNLLNFLHFFQAEPLNRFFFKKNPNSVFRGRGKQRRLFFAVCQNAQRGALFIALLEIRWGKQSWEYVGGTIVTVPILTVATVPDKNRCSGSFQLLQRTGMGSGAGLVPYPYGPVQKEPDQVGSAPAPKPGPGRAGGGDARTRVWAWFSKL